ncbi:hypothetical protein ABMA27_008227 [Loxostege sticticalis]|uniref:Reverse transcriptase domain-containing protein n=1 Tax=Loxostege sticticalis TaxID=481309 RepID=A0ABR3HAK8_LOXSC
MLKDGIIKPSVSPWSPPIWVVPKKIDASGQRKWRLVIDYRKLNDITIGDSYPIPNISEILDQLGKSKYFTTLDLASGFHQINMSKQDASKTAFSVPQGHFEFTRMPFGLKNAPSTFQRLMNTALSGLQGIQCFVYLDDIVIYSFDLPTHMSKLSNVFDRLRHCNLKLQPDKCEFLRKEVSYLGHVITDDGVKPNPEKTKAVQNFPQPKCPKDIKSLMGLVSYYRRFIPNLSKIAKPLTNLLKKDVPFNWQNEQQLAFESLKKCLISAPILAYPDFTKPFILTCDASNFAISAILSQGPIGNDRPIAYASRTLNKAESNYSITEKECLAIIFGTKTFRPYLYGRRFKIVTDHRPLKWLFNCKDPRSKLVRWRLKLEEFDYEVEYKKGKINSNADALSRFPVNPVIESESEPQPSTSKTPNDSVSNQAADAPANPDNTQDILDELIDLGGFDLSPTEVQGNDISPSDLPNLLDPPTNSNETSKDTTSSSNQEYNDFLNAFTNKDETFNTNILEHNESLLKTNSKVILIPTSIDLDESNPYIQDILSETDDPSRTTDGERELHAFKKLEVKGRTFYLLFTKVYYFEDCTYPEIFKTLKSARDDILLAGDINEIAISDFKNLFEQRSFCPVCFFFARLGGGTTVPPDEVFGTVRFQCRENEEIDIHQCHNMLQPLEALYNDIQRDFKSISHIISNSVAKRSAWFAGVGTVFKHIFGTMDEDDAENYKNAMLALYNNDKKLANSITKTIMVSQSAISNMNNSLHEINMNQAKLSDVIDQLTLSYRNVTKIINVMSFKAKLSSVFNILQSNLLTLSFKVEDLLNSILFVKSNTLHPSMLTPNQMYNDIVNNLKIIPKHRDFPVSLDINSIHTLINVAELVCYYLDNKSALSALLPLQPSRGPARASSLLTTTAETRPLILLFFFCFLFSFTKKISR